MLGREVYGGTRRKKGRSIRGLTSFRPSRHRAVVCSPAIDERVCLQVGVSGRNLYDFCCDLSNDSFVPYKGAFGTHRNG